MHAKIPLSVHAFMQTMREHTFEVYVVGGAVRNMLLGTDTTDWDFTTNATPEQIQHVFPDSFYHNTYGTVTVKWDSGEGEMLFEITPYRTEHSYTDSRRPDNVLWAEDVKDDLARRDFTMNAMAYDGETLIDPFGGQEDIKNKLIRTVGNADTRFSEDALRLLRAIRFAAQLGFLIEPQTRDSIARNAGLITRISWERIRDEFLRIITAPHASEGVLFLKSSNLLRFVLPELDACFDIPQKSPGRHHIYDVGTHLVMSLKHCQSKDPITRFATLIHDIGKVRTFHKDPKTEMITFYNHEVVGTRQAQEIADRFRLSNDQKDKLVRLVEFHQFVVSEDMTDNAIRRFIRNVTKDYLEDMFELRHADRLGGAAAETSWRTELFKKRVAELLIEPFTVKDLKVDGNDVMEILKIKPSRQVGEILDALFAKVENKEVANEREVLLEEIKTIKGN
ncbi:HD domain-containing protein [Candidatus Woesebacteria bacterium]|nr:HD domain-containing protein [Candidatus Woesebacteria bacterium]